MTLWQCRLWTLLWWKCAQRVSGRVFEKKTAEYICCVPLFFGLCSVRSVAARLVDTFLKNYSSNNFFCALTILAVCNPHVVRPVAARLVDTFLENYSSNNFFCALTILAICNPHVPCDLLQLGLSILSWKIIPLIIFFVHWQSSLFATRTFRATCCSSVCRYFLEKLFL